MKLKLQFEVQAAADTKDYQSIALPILREPYIQSCPLRQNCVSVPDFCSLGGPMEVSRSVDTLQVCGSACEPVAVSVA